MKDKSVKKLDLADLLQKSGQDSVYSQLNGIVKTITPTSDSMHQKAKMRTQKLAMPPRAMGAITTLSEKLCTITETLSPKVDRSAIFIMAGDHGVFEEGVAANEQDVTMLMLEMMLMGQSTVCVYAKSTNTRRIIADVGTIGDATATPKGCTFYNVKISRGTNNFTKMQAMSRDDAINSIITGYAIACAEIEEHNLNLIIAGEMGIANTTPSAAIGAIYTGLPPKEIAGHGAGISDNGLLKKIDAIERGIKLHNPRKDDPIGVLASFGGYEIGAMAGVYLAAAAHKKPILLDGIISTAAAMIAVALAPNTLGYLIAGHLSDEKGHKHMLDYLNLEPLLRLNMRLGEGTGAVCAIKLLELAAATISDVVTLEEAKITL